VHFHDIRILADLLRHKEANPEFDLSSARGAYLRLEIGDIEDEDEYVLYTDTDVMFRSLEGIESFQPWILAMAPEMDRRGRRNPNTGVMVINVRRFRRWVDRIYDLARSDPSQMLAHEQTAILGVLRWRWQGLPAVFNTKPYWGYSDQAKIMHWHGPKPAHAEMMLAGEFDLFPEPHQTLFQINPEAYRTYLAFAQELASAP
jgi:lipopolysaccharide biosynthesis glycosyltransferase